MEHRQLGRSGLKVPVLSLGTGTFGGSNAFFKRWGQTDVDGATRMVDLCLEAGVNFFDTADIYSDGMSEEVLGQVLGDRRREIVLASKFGIAMDEAGRATGTAPVSPCGRCRQVLNEAAQMGGRDLPVHCGAAESEAITSYRLSQLLPDAFGPADLGLGPR